MNKEIEYDMPAPGWLTVGANVVLVGRAGYGYSPTITETTVEKLTKRDIVLKGPGAQEIRYRHANRHGVRYNGYPPTPITPEVEWYYTASDYRDSRELMSPDNPKVEQARAKRAALDAWGIAFDAMKKAMYVQTGGSVEACETARDALTRWLEIEKARLAALEERE